MIRRLLLVTICMASFLTLHAQVAINETNFPDAKFREIVMQSYYDNNQDGVLSSEELSMITYIEIRNEDDTAITSLQGIEYFTNLQNLYVGGNVTSLDVRNLSRLKELNCYNAQLTTLEVSGLDSLRVLYCEYNQLTRLDLSGLSNLNVLKCSYNQLTELDLSGTPALQELNCYNNQLTSLDLSKNTSLSQLSCTGNRLEYLDISNTAIKVLSYTGGSSTKGSLVSLKVKNNAVIEKIECWYNQLDTLELENLPMLQTLHCPRNNLTNLDLSGLPSLQDLSCYQNHLTNLDLSGVLNLQVLDCSQNQLVGLDLSGLPSLQDLSCYQNHLTNLDLSGVLNLQVLDCSQNQLVGLDLSGLPNLKSLGWYGNNIWSLDLSNNPLLESLSSNISVTIKGTTIDTRTLPGFDKSKVSNLQGCEWNGDYIYFNGDNTSASYDYATGYTGSGSFGTINFKIELVKTDFNKLLDPTLYYDSDGDGIKEAYSEKKIYRWQDGMFVLQDEPSNTVSNVTLGLHVNNDGVLDFDSGSGFLISDGQGSYAVIPASGSPDYSYSNPGIAPGVLFDVDNDGRKDLFAYNNNDWSIHYQNPDGTFSVTRVDTMSQVQIDSLLSQKWKEESTGPNFVTSDGIPSITGDMFVRDAGSIGARAFDFTRSLDINKDGYMDLVGPITVLYNLGENRFIATTQPGELTVKDLNGDFIPDYIYNVDEGKRIYTRVYQGGQEFKEQTLVQDLAVSNIYCYDFDKDGDVDILLTFNYTDTFGFSFLLMCENDGKGNFTLHEQSYGNKWNFSACRDFDNDGYMELLASKQDENAQLKDLYLFRLDNMGSIAEPTELLLRGNFGGASNDYSLVSICEDIDNDGFLEIQVSEATNSYNANLNALFSVKDFLPGIPANEAPAKPAAPTLMLDETSGRMKLTWQPSTDRESSSADLTYALRIGSEPGLDDIYFSEANADGSRRSFNDGNMGTNLDVILDVNKWKQGTYYISVQAIDPMHRGSAWSDPLVYEHSLLKASFSISEENLSPDDTLSITTSPLSDAYVRNWDLAGGRIIEATADSSRLYVQFDEPGEKNITLTVTDSLNGASDVMTKTVLSQVVSYSNVDSLLGYDLSDRVQFDFISAFWDMDGNGTQDIISSNGFYLNDGTGKFTKLGTIFNSNLTFDSKKNIALIDYDLDGDADIFSTNNKGDAIVNNGNNSFEAQTINYIAFPKYGNICVIDVNNDGLDDLCVTGTVSGGVWKNKGDYIDDNDVVLYSPEEMFDLNRDGFVDFINIYERSYPYHGTTITAKMNNGNYLFEDKELFEYMDASYLCSGDFNSDGFLDFVFLQNERTLAVYWGNRENKYGEYTSYLFPLEISDYSGNTCFDFDNNGCPDILVKGTGDDCLILYMEQDKSYRIERYKPEDLVDVMGMSPVHINGDGVPDRWSSSQGYPYSSISVRFAHSNVKNEAPKVPRNIRASQEGLGILLQWDDAEDKETPAMQMRYNVSVKKKGATGAGAYIISPMNNLDDNAAILPGRYYQKATQKLIPVERLELGAEYEVQIQSIDLWDAHSPMSEVYTFTVESQVGISGPKEGCVQNGMMFTYRATEDLTEGAVWDWDGGIVLSASPNNEYEVYWETPGVKNISVSINGVTASKSVYVQKTTDLSFDFPEAGLAGTEITFMLPEAFLNAPEDKRWLITPPYGGVEIMYKVGTREAKAVFPALGEYFIEFQVEDTLCGLASARRNINIIGKVPTPVIDLVGIDAATGKNKVTWSMPGMPEYVTTVNIYKEGGKYNQFDSIAAIDPSAGVFVDMSSNPSVKSERYQIRLGTTFGVESPASRTHSGTHLMLNRGMGSAINLIWNQYEGGIVESYRILRGTSRDNLQLLAEVSGANTAYTDLTGGDGVYFYALEYDKTYSDEWQPLSVSLMAEGDEVGRSNVVCTDDALLATLAESMNILSLESEKVLTPSQPELHLSAEIFPVTADIRGVNWQIVSGSELATINQNGLLSSLGEENGEIIVRATAIDGSGIYAELTVEKKDFLVRPSSIVITTESGINTLTPEAPELQLLAEVQPAEASQAVTWSIVSGGELATLSEDGLLSAAGTENGTVVVRATSLTDPEIYAEISIEKKDFVTIIIPEGMEIGTVDNVYVMTPENPSIQFWAKVLPEGASQAVTWSIVSGGELATLSEDGLLTPVGSENGMITVRATSQVNPDLYSERGVEKMDFTDTGISKIEWDEVRIWVKGDLYVSGLPTEGKVRFRIIDMLGLSQLTASSEGVETARIELGRLASGTYILLVETKDGSKTFRFIK